MKLFRTLHSFAAAAVFAAVAGSIPSSAPAQNSPATPSPDAHATADSGTMDVSFQDTNVGEIVAYLRNRNSKTNIILGPGVADVTVDELKLHTLDIPTLLEAVRLAAKAPLIVNTLPNSPSKGWYLGLQNPASLVRFTPEVAAFNLSGYFALQNKQESSYQQTADDLTAIISKTVEDFLHYESESNTGEPVDTRRPEYFFHKGANLLVIVGTPQMIGIARNILDALPGIIPNSKQPAAPVPVNYPNNHPDNH